MNHWYRVTILISENTKSMYRAFGLFKEDSLIHYILAVEVFSKYVDMVELWRFSRYKYEYDDDVVMKFKFYTDETAFEYIKEKILYDKIVNKLKKEKLIKINIEKATESNDKVGSDRDNNWGYSVSESWPYFINGLSRMWLEMIKAEKEKYLRENYVDFDIDVISLSKLFSIYNKIKDGVVYEWIKLGSHAVYHHANAVFGYYSVRFNIDEFNLYYDREKNPDKGDEVWYKRHGKYDKYVRELLFKYKLRIFKYKPFRAKKNIGYINL